MTSMQRTFSDALVPERFGQVLLVEASESDERGKVSPTVQHIVRSLLYSPEL